MSLYNHYSGCHLECAWSAISDGAQCNACRARAGLPPLPRKHGPGGRGVAGPCDPDCAKCAMERRQPGHCQKLFKALYCSLGQDQLSAFIQAFDMTQKIMFMEAANLVHNNPAVPIQQLQELLGEFFGSLRQDQVSVVLRTLNVEQTLMLMEITSLVEALKQQEDAVSVEPSEKMIDEPVGSITYHESRTRTLGAQHAERFPLPMNEAERGHWAAHLAFLVAQSSHHDQARVPSVIPPLMPEDDATIPNATEEEMQRLPMVEAL